MLNISILLLSKKHILSDKLYEVLKRNYNVIVLDKEDIVKDRVNRYTSFFYGMDHVVFSTEAIWELFCDTDKTVTANFFSKLFSISNTEKIKITYINQDVLYDRVYLSLLDVEKKDFTRLSNYVLSGVEASDLNQIIHVSSVYGKSLEEDVINLLKSREIDAYDLRNLEGPVLADKVALFVSDNICRSGMTEYPEKRLLFPEWLMKNYKGREACSEDAIIRERQEHCVFDLVYKEEPNSCYGGVKSVAELRIELGRMLSEHIPLLIRNKIDFITPVPRTGLYYAMGLAESLNVPYRQALIKGTYSERSFSMADTDDRKKFLWKKIFPIPELVRGKSIAVVDEAIFTGTTLKIVCEMLWKCEAKEIFLCIPTPPCQYHCDYLVHPPRKMLLEYMNISYLREYFNVTDVFFQDKDSFTDFNLGMDNKVCLECFYGEKVYG